MIQQGRKIEYVVADMANGNKEALREFYDRFFELVVKFSRLKLKSEELIEEAVSDVFMKMWNNRDILTSVTNMENYLFIVTKNVCLNYIKRDKSSLNRELDFDIKEENSSPDISVISRELQEKIEYEVKNLPEKCKVVFKLIKEEGKSYNEVAGILNIPVKTVDSRLYLAIKRLRKKLNNFIS